MSVDMLRVDGVPVGQGCRWGSAFKRMTCGAPLAAALLFSSYALRRGSVRAARRFMRTQVERALRICLHQGAEHNGARAENWHGEVWKAHWHGSRPSEALEKLQNPALSGTNKFLDKHTTPRVREQRTQAA